MPKLGLNAARLCMLRAHCNIERACTLRTGLDSNAALVVTQCISRLCTNGDHIVTASIHQPRAAIWELFNCVALLSEGHTLYCGPTSEVQALSAHEDHGLR